MNTPVAARWGGGGRVLFLGWLYLHSDSHGACLGGYTFTLIRLALNGCREVSDFGSRYKMESSNRSHFRLSCFIQGVTLPNFQIGIFWFSLIVGVRRGVVISTLSETALASCARKCKNYYSPRHSCAPEGKKRNIFAPWEGTWRTHRLVWEGGGKVLFLGRLYLHSDSHGASLGG